MRINGLLRVGRITAGFDLSSWRVGCVRGVTAWEGRLGPLYVRRSGLPFSCKAASDVFQKLDNGPTGRLARVKREGPSR